MNDIDKQKSLKKGVSFLDMTANIYQMFKNPTEKIEPTEITSESQALQEIQNIIVLFNNNPEWDDVLQYINMLMSMVLGGATKYQSFCDQLIGIVPMINYCIVNLRSTLVKYGCLFITQLVQDLGEKFDILAESLLPILFQPTNHATAIISQSCKYTINSIVKYCRTKKVISALTLHTSSKCQEHRNIVSHNIQYIVKKYPKNLLIQSKQQIQSAISILLNDAGLEARTNVKNTQELLDNRLSSDLDIVPSKPEGILKNKNNTRVNTINVDLTHDNRTIKIPQFSSPQQTTKVRIFDDESQPIFLNYKYQGSLSNSYTTILKSNSELKAKSSEQVIGEMIPGKEIDFLNTIRNYKNESEILLKNSKVIVDGLMYCIEYNVSTNAALNIIIDIVPTIYIFFEKHLETLIDFLLTYASSSDFLISSSSTTLLRILPTYFDPYKLIKIAVLHEPTCILISFLSNIVRKDPKVLENDEISLRVLPICCKILEITKEHRFNALCTGLLTKINSSNPSAFNDFVKNGSNNLISLLATLHFIPNVSQTKKQTSDEEESQDQLMKIKLINTLSAQEKIREDNIEMTEIVAPTLSALQQSPKKLTQKTSPNPSPSRSSHTGTPVKQGTKIIFPDSPLKSPVVKNITDIETVILNLRTDEDKSPHFEDISSYIYTRKDLTLEIMNVFAEYIRSEFRDETVICIRNMCKYVKTNLIIEYCSKLFSYGITPGRVDLLKYVVQYLDNIPLKSFENFYHILTNGCNHKKGQIRMSSILCISVIYTKLGTSANALMNCLSTIQKNLVLHYINY